MTECFEDLFNLVCGERLGRGAYRDVYECKLRPDLVVKVESAEYRTFANVMEQQFWDIHQYYEKVSQWLAPCEFLSPEGRILLQRRVSPLPHDFKMPEKVPSFLTDLKLDNFGLLDGRLVCVDYALTILNPSTRLKPANWR